MTGPAGIRAVTVGLDDRSYEVLVGDGARAELASIIPPDSRRAAVITQPGIPVDVDPGIEHRHFEVPDGEAAKTLAVVEDLCRQLARWGMTRSDVVVAVGGGVVTDVAGFTAAVYHRGIRFVSVATSLLAQIDAAIGGKTGVNLPEGKNLVGAFWQPSGVICDTATLRTLPPAELRSGLGELAKYHFLGGDDLDGLERADQVARCVAIKAAIVAADEREGGRRAVLNYGHTLAHALETSGGYELRHGEAVAVGLVYAAEVAHRLGRIDDDRRGEHRSVVARYELPDRLPAGADPEALVSLFGRDKKAIEGVTLVLDGPAGVEPVVGIDHDLLVDAAEALR